MYLGKPDTSSNMDPETILKNIEEYGTSSEGWEKVAEHAGVSKEDCQKMFNSLTKEADTKDRRLKKIFMGTGGGPPPKDDDDPLLEKVKGLVGPTIDGLYTIYDGDSSIMRQLNATPIEIKCHENKPPDPEISINTDEQLRQQSANTSTTPKTYMGQDNELSYFTNNRANLKKKPHDLLTLAWHRPQSASFTQEQELMQSSSRAVETATDPVEKIRLLCLSHGAAGILLLGRIIRRMDGDGSKHLSRDRFIHTIKNTGLDLDNETIEALYERFDIHNNGSISIDEFLREIRPPMSENRRAIVRQAFNKLDKKGDGAITVDEIRAVYSPNAHPRYMSGEETAELIMKRFLSVFETEGISNGTVTLEEFMDYYSGLSVSIDEDSFFDLMLRKAYNL